MADLHPRFFQLNLASKTPQNVNRSLPRSLQIHWLLLLVVVERGDPRGLRGLCTDDLDPEHPPVKCPRLEVEILVPPFHAAPS